MAHFLRHYGSLIGMAAIVLFFWVMLPDTFMTARNWLNISQQLAMLIVVAVTMTVVMVMGDFDLSVGAMASLAVGGSGQWRADQLDGDFALCGDACDADDVFGGGLHGVGWQDHFRQGHPRSLRRLCKIRYPHRHGGRQARRPAM